MGGGYCYSFYHFGPLFTVCCPIPIMFYRPILVALHHRFKCCHNVIHNQHYDLTTIIRLLSLWHLALIQTIIIISAFENPLSVFFFEFTAYDRKHGVINKKVTALVIKQCVAQAGSSLFSLVMKLAAGWFLEEPHLQLTSHCFLTEWKTGNVNMFIYMNQYFSSAFDSLYFTCLLSPIVENIVLFASWCHLSAIRHKSKACVFHWRGKTSPAMNVEQDIG